MAKIMAGIYCTEYTYYIVYDTVNLILGIKKHQLSFKFILYLCYFFVIG